MENTTIRDVVPVACPRCKRLLFLALGGKFRCPCGEVISTMESEKGLTTETQRHKE